MEFEHEAHWALYQHVRDLLEREFSPAVTPTGDDPGFVVGVDDTPILVSIAGAGPRTAITIYARPAAQIEITPELALLLLRANFDNEIPFGSLGLNPDDAISLSHVLMGEGLDDDGFVLLLHLIASKLEDLESTLGRLGENGGQ